jgi:hypothetical protein
MPDDHRSMELSSGNRRSGTESSHDSPLEERVMCELVSESPKFPASRERTGNFHRLALRSPPHDAKYRSRSNDLRGDSLRIETGNFWGRTGNQISGSENFPARSGNPDLGLSRWHICRRRKADPTTRASLPGTLTFRYCSCGSMNSGINFV